MKRTMILKLVSKYDFPTKGILFLIVLGCLREKLLLGYIIDTDWKCIFL